MAKLQQRLTKGTTLKAELPPTSLYNSTEYTLAFLCHTAGHTTTAAVANTATQGWTLTVPASVTDNFATGTFAYELRVSDTDGNVFLYDSGMLTVVPSAASNQSDQAKTPAQLQLEKVRAAILDCLESGATEYAIGDRSVKKLSLSELYTLQARLEARVKVEQGGSGIRISLPNFLNTN